MTMQECLEQFLKSEDFKEGVLMSTRASWGGSGYSVELYPPESYPARRGTLWSVFWEGSRGNLYEPEGVILPLPSLECGEDFAKLVPDHMSEEEFLSAQFEEERAAIEASLRDLLLE